MINQATMSVTHDKPLYHTGGMVNAIAYINVLQPMTDVVSVVAKVTGKEECEWVERESYTKTIGHGEDAKSEIRHFMARYEGDTTLFKTKLPLWALGGATLMPGQYQIPFQVRAGAGQSTGYSFYADTRALNFQFYLPPGLPGSFRVGDHFSGKAEVKYKLKVTLDRGGWFSKDIKAKVHLPVAASLMAPVAPVFVGDVDKVNCCCCISKGAMSVSARAAKNAYMPGEMLQVVVECENMTDSIEVQTLEAELHFWMRLRSEEVDIRMESGHHHVHDIPHHDRPRPRSTKRVDRRIGHAVAHTPIQPGAKMVGDQAVMMQIQLPPGLEPTSMGSKVQAGYYVRLKAETGSCFLNDPDVCFPVQVYLPEMPNFDQAMAQFMPPADWAPTMMPATNFAPTAIPVAHQIVAEAPPIAFSQPMPGADPAALAQFQAVATGNLAMAAAAGANMQMQAQASMTHQQVNPVAMPQMAPPQMQQAQF